MLLVIALALSQHSRGSSVLTVDATQLTTAACDPSDRACEQATLSGQYAVFGACSKATAPAGCMHHRMASIALPQFQDAALGRTTVGGGSSWSVEFLIKGDFSLARCSTGTGAPECDLAVGLSDGVNVFATSRGYDFEDTLVPFPDSAERPAKKDAYNTMRNGGPNVGAWRARIEVRPTSTRMRIWSEGNVPPTTWGGGGYACSDARFACPRTEGGTTLQDLRLVLFRDDPPQSYWIEAIELEFALLEGSGGSGGGGADDSAALATMGWEITLGVGATVVVATLVAACVFAAFIATALFVARRRKYDEEMRALGSALAGVTFSEEKGEYGELGGEEAL